MSTKKKNAPPPEFKWITQASFALLVDRDDGRKLFLSVGPNMGGAGWLVAGVQTSVDIAKLTSSSDAVDRIGDDHAHQNVGTYETPVAAFGAAESYARSWLAKHCSGCMCSLG
jgi:hypothetical protein